MKRGSDPLKVQQWISRLERFKSSGLSGARFCQREGVSQPSFYQWKRKLAAQHDAGQPPVHKTRGQARATADNGQDHRAPSRAFQAVQVIGTDQLDPRPTTGADPCLTVRIPGGIELALSDHWPLIEWVVDKLFQALPQNTRPTQTPAAEAGETSC